MGRQPAGLRRTVASCLADDRLNLIVLPTEACNFRCRYCWESFSAGRMPPAVVRGLERFLSRRAEGLRLLQICWFGGEPLLALDIVERTMRHARALCADHPELFVASHMTTNGWLLERATFEKLVDLGVTEYQITLDGPARIHDRRRVRAGGQGTFARIWRNLAAMREVGQAFSIWIRVHLDEENLAEIPGLLDLLAGTFGGDPRFQVRLRAVQPGCGSAAEGPTPIRDGGADKRVGELAERVRDKGLAPEPDSSGPFACYAAAGNSFIFRADGRISKCTVALDDAANMVGRLHEDGRLTLDRELMLDWMRGLFSGVEGEMACPLVGLPGRGVPAEIAGG